MSVRHLKENIGQGFFLNFSNIEIINMIGKGLGATSFDEISSLHNLTCLFVTLDSSSIFNKDHTWMKRLKRFHIAVGENLSLLPSENLVRVIRVSNCEDFSNGELSSMLQFASYLWLEECRGLRKLIANKSFDGLKSLGIRECYCDFGPAEEGSGQIDLLPNLEILRLSSVNNLKSVSDFGQLLGLRFSKLRQLNISFCLRLTCLFNVSVPKQLEEISIGFCSEVVELFVQCSSSQIPRVRKLVLYDLSKLETFGEPWEHLEELKVYQCNGLRKLPLSIQTSNNIKVIRGTSEWWSQLEWDDDKFKSNLEDCFTKSTW